VARRTRRGADADGRMSFGAHLVELRKRLFRSAVAIAAATVVGYFFADNVLFVLRAPIEAIARNTGRTAELNYAGLTDAFDVKLQIAFTIGLVVSSPIWLYQIWAYIVPALKRSEKRYAFGFLGAALPLFLAGCATGWYVFPHTVQLLASFAPEQDSSIFQTKDYVDFVLKLVVAIGIGFVLPVFLVLLNFIGILSARSILKGWRISVLLITLFAAIATPSADVVTMFLLAIPMVVLYFLAAGVSWWHDRAVARRSDKLDAEIAI
jgi:sec-independent protein translocase protein TatC